jgi:hypothetical protein
MKNVVAKAAVPEDLHRMHKVTVVWFPFGLLLRLNTLHTLHAAFLLKEPDVQRTFWGNFLR